MKKLSLILIFLYPCVIDGFQIEPDTVISGHKYYDVTKYLERLISWTYGEKSAEQINCKSLLFSPDGKLLAVGISNINTGYTDQVWILDLHNFKWRLVTPILTENILRIHVYDLQWVSDKNLKIYLEKIDKADKSKTKYHVFQTSLDTVIKLNEKWPGTFRTPWDKPSKNYEIKYDQENFTFTLKNLKSYKTRTLNAKKYLMLNIYDAYRWTYNEKQFVFLHNYGHGEISLFVGDIEPKFKISRVFEDSWDLYHFGVSPYSSEIAVPQNRDKSITIYNTSNKKVSDKIIAGIFPAVYDWSPTKIIAFSSNKIGVKILGEVPSRRIYLVSLDESYK